MYIICLQYTGTCIMYKCYEDVTYVNSGVIVLFSSCFIYYDHFFLFQECLKQKITLKLYKWSFFSQVHKDCFESEILISTLVQLLWLGYLSFQCHCLRTDLELPWMAPLVLKYYQTWIFVSLVGVHNQIYDLYKRLRTFITFDFMYTWNLVLKVGQSQIKIEFKYKKIMQNNTF